MNQRCRRLSGACLALALAAGCRKPEAPRPAPARPAVSSQPAPPPIRPLALKTGTSVEAALAGHEAHRYRLDLPAGSFADLVIDQRGADVAVTLFGLAGQAFPVIDSPNESSGPEPIPVLGVSGGPLFLEVQGGATPGRYAVIVKALRPATARDRLLVAAERDFAAAEELRRKGDGPSLRAAAIQAEAVAGRFRDLGETGRAGDAFYAAGRARRKWDQKGELRNFQAALLAFRAVGDRRAVGRCLNSLGPIQLAQGHPEAALASYRDALASFRATSDTLGEAAALSNLGRTRATLGQAEEALDAYGRALTLWRQLGRRHDEGKTLANRGELFQTLGDERALADFDQALPCLSGQPEAAGVLASRGYLHLEAERILEADTDLRQALKLHRLAGDRRNEAVTLNSLGLLRQKQKRTREARQAFESAMAAFAALGDTPNEAAALTNLGDLLMGNGDAAVAEAAFRKALPTLASGRPMDEAPAWTGLAKARRAQHDLQGALRAAETGLTRIEALRTGPEGHDLRASYFATQQEAYTLAVELAVELGDPGRALGYVERARARSLLDALAEARVVGTRPNPLTAREIQSQGVGPDTLLLEYFLGERRSFLWAVSRDRLDFWELPSRSVLEEAAQRAHRALASTNRLLARPESEEALAELSRLLLAPAADRLSGRRLVVAPDRALHLVPFAALPDPVFQDGPLTRHREVVTVPSASSLLAIRKGAGARPPAPGVVAVLADPAFGGGPHGFPRLPQTREEARNLLALAPPGERLAALGLAARRDLATGGSLARFRVVHFATHAVVDPEHPDRSGIVLADGLLRSEEIYRLRLNADLVVLSACETALGREVRGEGVVGLTRAFLHAGARRLLVSLWPVEDQATTELMTRFYQGLFTDRLTPAAALRRAQEEARQTPGRSDPYFWAGFVLQGDPG